MFNDLPSYVKFLEQQGDLRRVQVPVDPELEITEIAARVLKARGPALLFERVNGSSVPLLVNFFGTEKRIEWALGRPPGQVGEELKNAARELFPPTPGALWRHRALFKRALSMKSRRVARPCELVPRAPNLADLPVLKCWPKDGGRFITYPLVFTGHPASRRRNIGVYRLQVYDESHTGMHWQIERGGDFHYNEAESRAENLPAAVVLGTDPILLLAGVLPLPEDMDELAFANFLRGKSLPVTRLPNGLEVPANAEIVLEGYVPTGEKRLEGPFGDHFGHYSQAARFPVFHIEREYRRAGAIYPAAVVGKPPQEDKYQGNAVQEMLTPLLKVMHSNLHDLWTYYQAGFHNFAVAAVKQRYKREALKTAFALLGQGQLSLTKVLVLVDPGVDVRSFNGVMGAVDRHFDPRRDFWLIPHTSQDTLDFTGYAMNLGSKMILDATSKGQPPVSVKKSNDSIPISGFGPRVIGHRNWGDALLVVKVEGPGRPVLESLLKIPALSRFKLIIAVGPDVPLDDEELLLWGMFTRFDCAGDFLPAGAYFRGSRLGGVMSSPVICEGGGWPVYQPPLAFDGTHKPGYPETLAMDPAVVERVNRRWKEYGLT